MISEPGRLVYVAVLVVVDCSENIAHWTGICTAVLAGLNPVDLHLLVVLSVSVVILALVQGVGAVLAFLHEELGSLGHQCALVVLAAGASSGRVRSPRTGLSGSVGSGLRSHMVGCGRMGHVVEGSLGKVDLLPDPLRGLSLGSIVESHVSGRIQVLLVIFLRLRLEDSSERLHNT